MKGLPDDILLLSVREVRHTLTALYFDLALGAISAVCLSAALLPSAGTWSKILLHPRTDIEILSDGRGVRRGGVLVGEGEATKIGG